MKVYEGKCGIKVTVLADSINATGERFTTYEIEYWRGILAELNTHRGLSKNSFSSRAVPFKKMREQLNGRPIRFGQNQGGMQDRGEDFHAPIRVECPDGDGWEFSPEEVWDMAKKDAIYYAAKFEEAGYHKQVYNRLVEPFQMQKTIISGTEWENFFWLRDDDAADPSIRELARVMRQARDESKPRLLKAGEWHLPYVDCITAGGKQEFYIFNVPDDLTLPVSRTYLTLEQAIAVSCARCAAVSYRNEGYGLAKSLELYDRLVGSEKKHASALEHCATPIAPEEIRFDTPNTSVNCADMPSTWEPGITHMDRNESLWSGNLKGFIQHRKLVPGENYEG